MNRFLREISSLGVARIVNLLNKAVIILFVAKAAGPNTFGEYAFLSSIFSLLTPILSLGSNDIFILKFKARLEFQNIIQGILFRISTWFIFVILLVLILYLTEKLSPPVIVMFTLHSLFKSNEFFQSIYYSKSKITYVGRSLALAGIISILLKSLMIYFDLVSLNNLLLVNISGDLFLFSIFIFGISDKISFEPKRFKINMSEIIKSSLPLFLSSVLIMAYMRTDSIMIYKYLGATSLGVFSISVKLYESLLFIPLIVIQTVFPRLDSEMPNYLRIKRKVYGFTNLISIVVVLISLPVYYFVQGPLLGMEYSQSVKVFSLMMLAYPFASIGVLYSKFLVVEGRESQNLIRSIFAFLVNFLVNLMLIPVFGIYGAIIATILSQMTSSLAFDIFNNKNRGELALKIAVINPFSKLSSKNE